jgi:hypothetical protein
LPTQSDNVLQTTLKTLWNLIKTNPKRVLPPEQHGNTDITKVSFGPNVKLYADIIDKAIIPEALAFMRDGRFDPRETMQNTTPLHSADHHADTRFEIYIYLFDVSRTMPQYTSAILL